MVTMARPHGGRNEHLLAEGTLTTRCGLDARLMARYTPTDNRVDSKVRPLCTKCRTTLSDKEHTTP